MKIFLITFLFLKSLTVFITDDKEEIKKLIDTFFEAFHKKDSATLKNLAFKDFNLISSSFVNSESKLNEINYDEFIKTISNRDNTTKWEEEILSYEINIDGTLAVAWTPYIFRVNDKIIHCGSNSFTLHKAGGEWKIIQIIDSRRNCD